MKDKKCFWIIDPYCAIPSDSWGYRHALSICDVFSNGEYEILYITANFSHATKQKRGYPSEIIKYNNYTNIILLPTREYQKHIGIRRLLWLQDFCKGLSKLFEEKQKIDLVYYPAPLIFGDYSIAKFKKKLNFKLIVDIRDLWPEIIINKYKLKIIRNILNIILLPVYISRNIAVKNSEAITAPSKAYLEKIGCPEKINCVVYYSPVDVNQLMINMQKNIELPINKHEEEYWVVMSGTLGSGLDDHALIEAARLLKKNNAEVKIIITGSGEKEEILLNAKTKYSLDNLVYLGVLPIEKLHKLYKYADIGLSAYKSGSTIVMPTKAYDYILAGLIIVNSIEGDFSEFINYNKIGLNYNSSDGKDLVRCIMTIKNNEILKNEFKINLKKISGLFDRKKQYESYLNIAKKIMI